MTYKDLFDEAFGSLENGDRRMSDSEFAAAVRAKAQRSTVLVGSGGSLREIHFSPDNRRPHRMRNAVAATAAAAAVFAGGFFGLKYLNEYGALKERAPATAGAGTVSTQPTGTADAYTMPVPAGEEFAAPESDPIDPETLPDIHDAIGKTIEFHDATVRLTEVDYDGVTFNAKFNVLYTGAAPESYSPEYLRPVIGYTLVNGEEVYLGREQDNFKCRSEYHPEADSYSHVLTYTVPIKLEPNRAYSVRIEYFDPNSGNTQPIEADRQLYKFVYSDLYGVMYDFERVRVKPAAYSFDGLTLDMKYWVEFKDNSVKDAPYFGLVVTTPQTSVYDFDSLDGYESSYVHLRVQYLSFADKCDVTFNENGTEYTFTATRPESADVLSFDREPPDGNGSATYLSHVDVTASAVSLVWANGTDKPPVTPPELVIELGNGEALNGTYLTQANFNGEDIIRYDIPGCTPSDIKKIYFGTKYIYESPVKEYGSAGLTTKVDQWVEFTNADGGITVRFDEFYFDGTVLKLRYEVHFPQGVPEDNRLGRDRIEPDIMSGSDYAPYESKVISQTAGSLSFENMYAFYRQTDEVTVAFDDTSMTGEDVIPFRLKCGRSANDAVLMCDEPYEHIVTVGEEKMGELMRVIIHPAALTAVYNMNRISSTDDVPLYILGDAEDVRVVLTDGSVVGTGQSTVRIVDDTLTAITPFKEVTDTSEIGAVYIGGRLVWDRSRPEGGYVPTMLEGGMVGRNDAGQKIVGYLG